MSVVLAAGHPVAADALEMYTRMTALPIEVVNYETQRDLALEKLRTAQVLVDAVFGIGFYGDPNAQTARLFEAMSASPALKIAVDLPRSTRSMPTARRQFPRSNQPMCSIRRLH